MSASKAKQAVREQDVHTIEVNERVLAAEDGLMLGNGDLSSKVTITAHFFSKTAEEKISKAGGKTVKAFRTLEEASKVNGLPLEEALLKEKAKVVKVVRKRKVKP